MQNKLYVGGLSWDTNSESLHSAFESCGAVREAKVITDRDSGRSRGFGFVTFESEESAEQALSLDDTELDGRRIKVSIAREKSPRW